MFLWVTDFYSLEKIISVSPQDCVTVFKEETTAQREGGGWVEERREDGERGRGGFFFRGRRRSLDWTRIAVGLYILRPQQQEENWNASVRRARFGLQRYTQILSNFKRQHTGQIFGY